MATFPESGLNITTVADLRPVVQVLGIWAFPDIMESVLFAFFTAVIVVSTSTLIKRGLQSLVNRVLLGVSLTMYAMSALAWAGHLRILWQDLNIALSPLLTEAVEGGLVPIGAATYSQDAKFVLLHVCTNVVNVLLGDAVALWRAYTIWGSPRWLLLLSCAIIFSLLCLHVFNAVVFVALDLTNAPTNLLYLQNIDGHNGSAICGVTMGWTAFSNILATCLIGYKTWQHWRDLRELMNKSTRSTATTRILSLLIESGLIYSALWVVNIAASCPGSIGGPIDYFWPLLMSQISGMYPTLIVVIVALRQSQLEHEVMSDVLARDSTTTHGNANVNAHATLSLHFASNPGARGGAETSVSSGLDESWGHAEREERMTEKDVEKGVVVVGDLVSRAGTYGTGEAV